MRIICCINNESLALTRHYIIKNRPLFVAVPVRDGMRLRELNIPLSTSGRLPYSPTPIMFDEVKDKLAELEAKHSHLRRFL